MREDENQHREGKSLLRLIARWTMVRGKVFGELEYRNVNVRESVERSEKSFLARRMNVGSDDSFLREIFWASNERDIVTTVVG